MIREHYVLFWGMFFVVTTIGGFGIILCLSEIIKCLKEIAKKMPHSHIFGIGLPKNE